VSTANGTNGRRGSAMLIDAVQPSFDATRIEYRVVEGSPDTVFEVARNADFLRAVTEQHAVRILFALRGAAERVAARVRSREPIDAEEPDALILAGLPTTGEWVKLGENPPHETAFGAIGRFWAGETTWEEIRASDFAAFERPGFGKIACNLSLRPYGPGRTLVSYEARTRCTDPRSRRAFRRYWRVLSPFVGVVMRALLSVIERDALREAERNSRPMGVPDEGGARTPVGVG